MASASTSVWVKAAHTGPTLKPDSSVLTVWHFLSCCLSAGAQSEWVHQWVCPCEGPLRGTPGTQADFHLTQPQSLVVFTTRSYRFYILVVIITQLHTFVKTHKTGYLKWVHLLSIHFNSIKLSFKLGKRILRYNPVDYLTVKHILPCPLLLYKSSPTFSS